MALASWEGGCLGPLYPGILPAEDLVLAWQNKAGEQAGAWGYGPEGPSSLLLWATHQSPCLPVRGAPEIPGEWGPLASRVPTE